MYKASTNHVLYNTLKKNHLGLPWTNMPSTLPPSSFPSSLPQISSSLQFAPSHPSPPSPPSPPPPLPISWRSYPRPSGAALGFWVLGGSVVRALGCSVVRVLGSSVVRVRGSSVVRVLGSSHLQEAALPACPHCEAGQGQAHSPGWSSPKTWISRPQDSLGWPPSWGPTVTMWTSGPGHLPHSEGERLT